MAFFSKVGNILRQTASKRISCESSVSNPSIYQAIRCMSSSKLFVGGASCFLKVVIPIFYIYIK